MKNIVTIARNTFRETIRDRILYVILAFAVLFILSTIFFGSISLGEDIKVIKDFGLAGIYLFSLIITVFLGGSLIYKEIEKRTLYILLSKPVSSLEVVVGKFLGLFVSIFLTIVIMTAIYLVVVAAKGGGFDSVSLLAILMQLFEVGVFISLMILFSTFATPLASTIYAVLILYIGHSLNLIVKYVNKNPSSFRPVVVAIYYILPNLEKFNLRNLVVHDVRVSGLSILYAFFYAILYSSILLILATWSLKKQDL